MFVVTVKLSNVLITGPKALSMLRCWPCRLLSLMEVPVKEGVEMPRIEGQPWPVALNLLPL